MDPIVVSEVDNKKITAYFSMEIAIKEDIPTYSGGLGVLAGDILRSAADKGMDVVGVTLCYQHGYFYQMLNASGEQSVRRYRWQPGREFKKTNFTFEMNIDGRTLMVGAWKYIIHGLKGSVPVYLLTTDLEDNDKDQREYTSVLYEANEKIRIIQEAILGIGGVKLLFGIYGDRIGRYHMNEGHAAFLTLELYKKYGSKENVKKRCIFTTHTPVAAGHDIFPKGIVQEILGSIYSTALDKIIGGEEVNMSILALEMSSYANAVSKKHCEVSRNMFPKYDIDYITNGIHIRTWIHPKNRELYEYFLPNFIDVPETLRNAGMIPSRDLWNTHQRIKETFIDDIRKKTWQLLQKDLFTIGFARRITGYKRPTLIFNDLDTLGSILKNKGQIVIAGKSHPCDTKGMNLIKDIFQSSDYLWDNYGVSVVFIQNYNMALAKEMVAAVDIWLNTPCRYLEASGTSGMKAALNAVPHLSVLDGWWIEAYEMCNGTGGWVIGPYPDEPTSTVHRTDEEDAMDLYYLLEKEIIPMYYNSRDEWIRRMKSAIALASYFNTHRVVDQYMERAYTQKL